VAVAKGGGLMDPKSWGEAIQQVGPSYAVIFALLAILGYLAFKGVPEIMELTTAIQKNTDIVADSTVRQERNQEALIANQTKGMEVMPEMMAQHQHILSLLADRQIVLNLAEQTCLNTAKVPYQQRKCMAIRTGSDTP
jgi:hypothetical protein